MQDDSFSTVYGDLGGKQPNVTQTTESTLPPPPHPPLPTLLSAKEAEALRQENSSLRSVNRDLNKQLSALIQASVQNHFSSSDYNSTPFELVNALRGLCLGAVDVERVMLPKSISVRSNGYLKMMNQAGESHRGKARGPTRTGNTSQLSGALTNQLDECTAEVYVQGGKRKKSHSSWKCTTKACFKTELCNKWQETGACPYGDHCQFAHGIEELRPVIRHPRYKTEVCRMVLLVMSVPMGIDAFPPCACRAGEVHGPPHAKNQVIMGDHPMTWLLVVDINVHHNPDTHPKNWIQVLYANVGSLLVWWTYIQLE
ncbi:Zinc finger C-x8-C-x5-C-x3-H type family protein, putative isoform 3 [Hibiscus syriacus]|uniref:Zinc finger C-x8-C-x5-C-x3-H type family protein, putative isoform 3 n=1 Tax=Hibiscus syriacus TaxID=106335 RepID=A0A6A3AWI5_HIBSY|nr:Zinc finger C-x8-C-x5-C-x3-H type family protein, putative isoform 3 [Hibiscus syriacus]